MKTATKSRIRLFATAWLQVALVACNTWQIANEKWLGALIVGFAISLVWSFNVSKIALSTLTDKIIYSIGACTGTGTGLIIAATIYT